MPPGRGSPRTGSLSDRPPISPVRSKIVTPARSTSPSQLLWCVLAGGWSLVFAAPHFYWALGGRAGLGAQAAAADAALQQGWFATYNLAAGCLGILGAVVAAVLAMTWGGRRVHRWLLVAATVACVVLLLRGALGLTLLGASVLAGTFDEQAPVVLLVIEPWFVLGGLAFGGMALSRREKPAVAGSSSH
jgi:uncharacterized membrane protein YeaQ/YmgE (transglycosylase-associated protein family)